MISFILLPEKNPHILFVNIILQFEFYFFKSCIKDIIDTIFFSIQYPGLWAAWYELLKLSCI